MNGATLHANDDPMAKLKLHFSKYQDAYIMLGSGMVIGLALGSIFRGGKKPKVDEAAIVWKWMQEQVKNGFNVYALSNEQKDLWEATWKWLTYESTRVNVPMSDAMRVLTESFSEFPPKLQYA